MSHPLARYRGIRASQLLAAGLCVAAGVLAAQGLQQALRDPIALRLPSSERKVAIRVAMRPAPAPEPPAPAPEAILPIRVDKPVETPKPRPAPRKKPQDSAPKNASTPAPAPEPAPEPAPVSEAHRPITPGLGAVDAPRPPQATSFTADQPGGRVVVIGLLLNDQGYVVDTRILLPSGNALEDVTLALASRGQRWRNVVPPLAPGEMRWVEYRVEYAVPGETVEEDFLP